MNQSSVDLDLLESAVSRQARSELRNVRSAALARLRTSGLPTTRHEDWKYTSLAPVAEISNAWLSRRGQDDASSTTSGLEPPAIEATWVKIRNGRLDDEALIAVNEALAGKATLRRLSAAAAAADLYMDDAVASLNAALMDDALCLDVRQHAVVERPLGLLLADETGGAAGVSQVRLVVRLAAHASIDLIEMHRSAGDGEHFASIVTELTLGEGARARYVKVQERADHHVQIGRLQASLGKDATLEHASVDLGGRLVRNDVNAAITASGARFDTAGLYLADGRQHVDNHICADHRVGPATSSQVYRGIAGGRARCVFNGKAVVREGADGTDAEQSNHNLLLSDKAEVDTKPELEIYAEDVKCAHGATVGQLDRKSLFYLRSRGLDRDQAAQVLTRAFANSVLENIPIAAVRDYVNAATEAKLDRLVGELDR